MSVYKILEINNFLKFLNSSFEKLAKKLVSGSQSIFIEVAAWCYSNTLLSWYLIAKLERLLISNKFVLPVWATSWHKPEIIKANLVKELTIGLYLV